MPAAAKIADIAISVPRRKAHLRQNFLNSRLQTVAIHGLKPPLQLVQFVDQLVQFVGIGLLHQRWDVVQFGLHLVGLIEHRPKFLPHGAGRIDLKFLGQVGNFQARCPHNGS